MRGFRFSGSHLFLDWPISSRDPILKPPIGMFLQDEGPAANFGHGQTASAGLAVVNGFTKNRELAAIELGLESLDCPGSSA